MGTVMDLLGDIDIDTGDRNSLLAHVPHIPAVMERQGNLVKHNTGVYFHQVPVNPFGGTCSLHYQQAHKLGCYKIDLLNNHIYQGVRSEHHLQQLLETDPPWELLQHALVCEQLVHINQHADLVRDLKPQNVKELAMVLALIRPGKRHLVQRCMHKGYDSIQPEIWQQDHTGYTFKKAHAISLACTIVVQLNLLVESLADQLEPHTSRTS